MRRVNSNDVDGQKAPTPTGDLGAQLGKLLSGLEDLKNVQKTVDGMNKEIHSMWSRINKAEKMGDKATQYIVDHNELHRNMAKAHGDDKDAVQKQIAAMVAQHTKTMQDAMQAQVQVLSTAIATLQVAIEEFTNKKVDVNIGQPEQTIHVATPEPKEKRYKIVRNQNGLMDEIVEREA